MTRRHRAPQVSSNIVFVDSDSEQLVDNPRNAAYEHFLAVFSGAKPKMQPVFPDGQEKENTQQPFFAQPPNSAGTVPTSGAADAVPTEPAVPVVSAAHASSLSADDVDGLDGITIPGGDDLPPPPPLPTGNKGGKRGGSAKGAASTTMSKKAQLEQKRAAKRATAGTNLPGTKAKKANKKADSSDDDSSDDDSSDAEDDAEAAGGAQPQQRCPRSPACARCLLPPAWYPLGVSSCMRERAVPGDPLAPEAHPPGAHCQTLPCCSCERASAQAGAQESGAQANLAVGAEAQAGPGGGQRGLAVCDCCASRPRAHRKPRCLSLRVRTRQRVWR